MKPLVHPVHAAHLRQRLANTHDNACARCGDPTGGKQFDLCADCETARWNVGRSRLWTECPYDTLEERRGER